MASNNDKTASNGNVMKYEVTINNVVYDPYQDYSPEYIAARNAIDACTTQQQVHELLQPAMRNPRKDMAGMVVEGKKAIDAEKVNKVEERKARFSLRRAFGRMTV